MRRFAAIGSLAIITASLVACGGDGTTLQDPVFAPPATTTATSIAPTTTPLLSVATLPPEPIATDAPATSARLAPVFIDSLSSPENAVAEFTGTGARPGDPVTVDDEPADILSFDVDADGNFVGRARIEDEGAHTLCVADTCGRVFTLAPDAESREEVIAKIEAAIAIAEDEYGDVIDRFPEWSIEIGGALAGTGGSTDDERRVVTVYRNRGREVDEFVRTILHEYGHVVDAELMDDDKRAAYRSIRGIEPDVPWRTEGAHRLDEWKRQPSEDFAEVVAMIWSDGEWTPRTALLAPAPDDDQLAAVAALVGL